MSEALLDEIADYCRRARLAESTFGRLAVNDGKLVGRLRLGGRVTEETRARVHAFMARQPQPEANGVLALPSVPLPAREAASAPARRSHSRGRESWPRWRAASRRAGS
ncbi:MAG: hypothetical protein ACREE4_09400 [Stellaceae bacterium]